MKLVEILQGKWLGHPLHPALVHVPLGLWLLAAIFDVLIVLDVGVAVLTRLSLYCVIGGLIGVVPVVPTGFAEWAAIKKEKPAWRLALYHMLLNLLAILVWAGNLALRLDALDEVRGVTRAVLVTSLLGAALLVASGYLGSLMVFDHGIGVARFSKKKWRSIAARAGSRLPEEK